jgi:hypothetical protein
MTLGGNLGGGGSGDPCGRPGAGPRRIVAPANHVEYGDVVTLRQIIAE